MTNIALCCSPLQVLVAAAAIRLNSKKSASKVQNILCIHHGGIGVNTVAKICQLGNILGFDHIFDFSSEAEEIQMLQAHLSRPWYRSGLKKIKCRIDSICMNMKNKLEQLSYEDVELYCRPPRIQESIFINKVLNCNSYSFIEDGFGDNLQDGEINFFWPKVLRSLRKFFLSRLLLLEGVSLEYMPHLIKNSYIQKNKYMISDLSGATSVMQPLRELLGELHYPRLPLYARVIVLGTLFDSRHSLEKIICEYICTLKQISWTLQVQFDEIIFRPHHRASEEELAALEEKLPCIIDKTDYPLAELLFIGGQIEVVYAHHSTAVINAKRIFGLKGFFIDSELNRSNKRSWHSIELISERFDIPFMRLGSEYSCCNQYLD